MGVSSLPIQAHGLRSACSSGPASVCAAIQDVGVNPGGISSPGSVGARCVDLVGDGKKVLEEGWLQGDRKPLLYTCSVWVTAWVIGPDSCLDGP